LLKSVVKKKVPWGTWYYNWFWNSISVCGTSTWGYW